MPYWSKTFPGQAACLSEVRRFTTVALGDLPGVDAVELVVSELAGNAIQHTASGRPGGYFTLHLAALKDCWLVRVDDDGGVNEPQVRCADADEDETGRGLALVSELSSKWGVVGGLNARGVWAQIPAPESVSVNGDWSWIRLLTWCRAQARHTAFRLSARRPG